MTKVYTIPELKNMAAQQKYVRASLEDVNGLKIMSFNPLSVKIAAQLEKIAKRLQSEAIPSGVYRVALSRSIRDSNNPDRFTIKKGEVPESVLSEAAKQNVVIQNAPQDKQILSYEKGLEMNKEIAELKAENGSLKKEIESLKSENAELESSLDAYEEGTMSEGNGSAATGGLKDTIEKFMPLAQEFFNLEKEKLGVRKMEILHGRGSNGHSRKFRVKPKHDVPGSQAHIDKIRGLADSGGPSLDEELDKLEAANPKLYDELCEELGLFSEEEGTNDAPQE